MKKMSLLFVVALLASVASQRPVAAQLDKVFIAGKAPVAGTVQEMSKDKVTVDVGGAPRTFEVNDIAKITYGDDPQVLTKSREAALAGQLEAALTDLNSISPDGLRDVAKQDVLYYRAFCAAKISISTGGKREEAITGLMEFVKGNPGSYHFYEAAELLGDLATAGGDHAKAAVYYGQLAKAPWADYKLRANVMVARALTAQKKFAEALEKYDLVIKSDEGNAEANRQKTMAKVGTAVCLAETGKPDEGLALVEDVIKNNDSKDSLLFARAYNALGTCHLKANRSKDALTAFLHVDLLYGTVSDAHAESLFYLTKLWSDVNKADRALDCRTTLKSRYGGSPWAKAL